MPRTAGKGQVAGSRALPVSPTPSWWELATAQTPLGQGLLSLVQPDKLWQGPHFLLQCHSPSQGQQVVGQETDSTR